MRLSRKRNAHAVIVDGIRFDDIDFQELHEKYGYYFNLWQYSEVLDTTRDAESDALLFEIFIIFNETRQEYIENGREESIGNSRVSR